MDFRSELERKSVPVEEAVMAIPSNSYLFSYGPAEPYGLLENLQLLKGKRQGIVYVSELHNGTHPFYTDEEMRGVVDCESPFFMRFCSNLQLQRRMSYVPGHLWHTYHDILARNEREGVAHTVYAVSCSPMDAHGYFSTGIVGMANRELVQAADTVIVEVNPNMPRTFGHTFIHIDEVDYVYQGPGKVIHFNEKPLTEQDRAIGTFIADMIPDEATLQLGIGTMPNAVSQALVGKRDLGIHTEMLNDSLVNLIKCGTVTNQAKTLYRGLSITAFTNGSQGCYDFLDDNPAVLHLSIDEVNDPAVIAQNRRFVSVNSALQVDLMGQCASEAIGTRQISGIGGQTLTAMGARLSPGGKSIICLHSLAMVRGEDGARHPKSTIVAVHPEGTVVSLNRADVDYVVTEYGVASLRGASLARRARELIAIAHPDYRDELAFDAKSNYLM